MQVTYFLIAIKTTKDQMELAFLMQKFSAKVLAKCF